MNARFLFLPVLALFVALSGCDAGSPTTEGLQASPTAPTANGAGTITGEPLLHIYCAADYTYEGFQATSNYWTISSGSAYATLSYPSTGVARLTANGSNGVVTLEYRTGAGVLLDDILVTVKVNGGNCPIDP